MAKAKKAQQDTSKIWGVMSVVTGLLAANVAKKGLNGGWRAVTGKTPPANPADPDVDLWEAVAWAAVSGTSVALARMFAGRRAANYYTRSTGHLPPELESDEVRAARQAARDEEDRVAAEARAAEQSSKRKSKAKR